MMKSVNSALLWRLALIVVVPLAVVAIPLILHSGAYTLYPQSAAGLRFGIQLEQATGETCLVFRSDPIPDGLREYLCPD